MALEEEVAVGRRVPERFEQRGVAEGVGHGRDESGGGAAEVAREGKVSCFAFTKDEAIFQPPCGRYFAKYHPSIKIVLQQALRSET